jgi:hypothetical protein
MRRNEVLDAVVAVLDDAEIGNVVRQGRKHLKIFFVIDGRERMCVCGGSTSDVNAQRNARAIARRMIAGRM